MKKRKGQSALDEVIARIQDTESVSWLTIAMACCALDNARLRETYEYHVKTVSRNISKKSVASLFQWLTIVAHIAPWRLTPRDYAQVARVLVACERAPGGPYVCADDSITDVAFNAVIAQFFRAIGVPLLKVEKYLKSIDPVSMSATEQIYCLYPRALIWYEGSQKSTAIISIIERVHKEHAANALHEQVLIQRWIDRSVAVDFREAGAEMRRVITRYLEMFSCHGSFDEAHNVTKEAVLHTKINATQHDEFARANVYFWAAYTIYDHVVDGRKDAAAMLPLANAFHRASFSLYGHATIAYDQQLTKRYFLQCDVATARELRYARAKIDNGVITIESLPTYRNTIRLSDHSMVHALGPVYLAPALERRQVEAAFRHYLTARQLSDDLLDWKEDLRVGHLSAVVATILREVGISKVPTSMPIDVLLTKSEQVFLQRAAHLIGKRMLHHARTAQRLFRLHGVRENTAVLHRLLQLEMQAMAAIKTRDLHQEFAGLFT